MTINQNRLALAVATLFTAAAMLAGCTQPPAFLPNSDPAMRKTSAQFAADAAHRHYESDAPKGGEANGSIDVDYGMHRLHVVNSSNEDWNNIELWFNQTYVIFIPNIPGNHAKVETIDFQSIFDEHGTHLPSDAGESPINTVEMYKDGKMYSLGVPKLAD
jgi:hypothetical protein